MRIRLVAAALLLVFVFVLGGGGCFSPDFQDGVTPCGPGGECPGTLLCAADKKCYNAGNVPEPCASGFERSGSGTCVDVDECARGTATCDAHAACTNSSGSYTCTCTGGWSGTGMTCSDVDECAAGTAGCDVNATCTNSPGSYACACKQGYTGDGKSCSQSFTQIVSAGDHSCALRADGALYCWGANQVGQLGAGPALAETHVPVRIGKDSWTSIAVAYRYSCGIKSDGTLWCWGDDVCAVIGDGASNNFCDGSLPVFEPFATGGTAKWKALATAASHACAIQMDGSLWCWGEDDSGDLGTNDNQAHTTIARVGQDAPSDKNWDAVTVGDRHSCGLRTGQLWCWGSNDSGQLGDGRAEVNIAFPRRIGTATGYVSVAAGDAHGCAVLSDKSMVCWGDGSSGQLGLGASFLTTGSDTPQTVPGGTQWVQVAAGQHVSCGRTTTGGLYCFGDNTYGEIGDGSFAQRPSPAAVTRATDWSSVSVGLFTVCATKTGGDMWCWGRNLSGAIGAGSGGELTTPKTVAGSAGFTQLAGGSSHQCGIKSDKSLLCWGANYAGQLGIGEIGGYRDAPTPVMGGGSWTFVAAGDHSTCAIQTGGALYCWGANYYGELGTGADGADAGEKAPKAVSGGGVWSRVGIRQLHGCGLRTDGTLWCWGASSGGRLGLNPPLATAVDAPAQVSGSGYTALAVGDTHTCAITGGSLVCFGQNGFGQLGNGQKPPNNPAVMTPQIIGGNSDWTLVTAGQYHTCGVRGAASTLFCWGYNFEGQLGDGSSGSNANAYDPAFANTNKSWLAIGAGDSTTCGVSMEGDLYCWGSNSGGLVGNANAGQIVVTPVLVDATLTYLGVEVMSQAGCALHGDGSYGCWGSSPGGEFGDDTAFYESPVRVQTPL